MYLSANDGKTLKVPLQVTPVFPFQMLLLSLSKKKKYIFKCFHEKIVTLLFLVWNSNLFYCFFLNAFQCFLKSSVVKSLYIHVHIYFSIILFSPQTYSIEFDRDFDYFAIAGVTKKIKVLLSLFILFLAYFITSRISEIVIVAKNPSFCYLSSFDEYLWQSAIQGDLCIQAS